MVRIWWDRHQEWTSCPNGLGNSVVISYVCVAGGGTVQAVMAKLMCHSNHSPRAMRVHVFLARSVPTCITLLTRSGSV